MRSIKQFVIITLLVLIAGSVALFWTLPGYNYKAPVHSRGWYPPDISILPQNRSCSLIRYGRELVEHTSSYFGPQGSIARISNGMNCQNCHLDAGTRPYANSFGLVAANYPRFRARSGRAETVEYRINECMERSMNGEKLDSASEEMKAMVAYITWVGKNVKKGERPAGSYIPPLPYMERAASPEKGRAIYIVKCQRCHGTKGQGLLSPDSARFVYPPLWGPHSYNVSAGMYRLSQLAAFLKYNMPYDKPSPAPELLDEEAWDLAAFINSQERPERFFLSDWPDISKKPIDHPFGPYSDPFSQQQHKYGPFPPIVTAGKNNMVSLK